MTCPVSIGQEQIKDACASEPVFPTVPGVPGRVSKDGRAKRPNFFKTAVLGVDGRALPSLVRWLLPVVICRAWLSTVGPCRQL